MATDRRQRRRETMVRIGTSELVMTDARPYDWRDPYHALLSLPWGAFLATVLAYYAVANAAFALLYACEPGSIANLPAGAPLAAFFFSVETFATVGYGVMAPQTLYGHCVATLEIFAGLLSTAVITGLVFVRFARPRASLVFSRHITIAPYDGVPTLMLRVGNSRASLIVNAEARLTLLVRHVTREGYVLYRAHELPLVCPHSQAFALSWTLMHTIDEASPLHGMTPERLAELDAGLIASVTGTDRTLAAPVTATQDYEPEALLWGHRFVDMMAQDASGRARILLARLHDVVPV